jgi:RNA polymerase sigma-70 factor (ECF subfamily)
MCLRHRLGGPACAWGTNLETQCLDGLLLRILLATRRIAVIETAQGPCGFAQSLGSDRRGLRFGGGFCSNRQPFQVVATNRKCGIELAYLDVQVKIHRATGEFAMTSVALRIARRTEASSASNSSHSTPQGPLLADPLAAIVAGCRRRDPAAQRELVVRTQQLVFGTVYRLTGPRDAEDVVQQVYLQVFRQLDQFVGASSLGTWVYRIAVNEALQHLRRQRARPARLASEPAARTKDFRQGLELHELVNRALANLEPDLRAVVVLREMEGLTYDQIADVLHIPAGTVASRLSRARLELQAKLTELGYGA